MCFWISGASGKPSNSRIKGSYEAHLLPVVVAFVVALLPEAMESVLGQNSDCKVGTDASSVTSLASNSATNLMPHRGSSEVMHCGCP